MGVAAELSRAWLLVSDYVVALAFVAAGSGICWLLTPRLFSKRSVVVVSLAASLAVVLWTHRRHQSALKVMADTDQAVRSVETHVAERRQTVQQKLQEAKVLQTQVARDEKKLKEDRSQLRVDVKAVDADEAKQKGTSDAVRQDAATLQELLRR